MGHGSTTGADELVSVVVSTYQREGFLPELVRALELQTLSPGRFEVVVVDNGSTDGTFNTLRRLASGTRINLRPFRLECNVGSSGGRNAGVREARGEIVAFTDDDCVPDPDWLRCGLAAMRDGADLVQGVTVPVRELAIGERSVTHTRLDGLLAACNVFYRRDAFLKAGGFDEGGARLGFGNGSPGGTLGFGEDTLAGWRVARNGRVSLAQDAVVRHAVIRSSAREMLSRAWMARGFPALVRSVPELRTSLLKHRVLLGTRRLPLYTAIAAAIFARRRVAVIAILWWIAGRVSALRRQSGSWKGVPAAVPAELAVDVVTAAGLAEGSVRTRTIVL